MRQRLGDKRRIATTGSAAQPARGDGRREHVGGNFMRHFLVFGGFLRRTSALAAMAVTGSLLCAAAASAESIVLKDPTGDDKGPGNYSYPTDPVYKRGSFDLTEVEISESGDSIEVKLTINSKIEDPWQSRKWEGNGFSVQMAIVHIDTDRKAGSGHKDSLPGFNVEFADESRWDKALVISAQGNRRLKSEINEKCGAFKKDLVLPTSVSVKGKSIVARYPKSEVGSLSKSWGYQVLMQSNEGYPDKGDFLTRKVNEFNGQHRFGGGSDFDCDPHVIDMFAGKAQGDESEAKLQYEQLSTYKCDDNNPDGGKRAVIGMIYPGG
jgi:carbohydrate-binding DOMON domain-containing protein